MLATCWECAVQPAKGGRREFKGWDGDQEPSAYRIHRRGIAGRGTRNRCVLALRAVRHGGREGLYRGGAARLRLRLGVAGGSVHVVERPTPTLGCGAGGVYGAGWGIVLLGSDGLVDGVVSWVWPPALLVLVVWMFIRARRELHSRTRVLLLYPVLAALVLVSLGGGVTRGSATPSPCAGSWSTWGSTGCTWTAPVHVARPWCSSPARGDVVGLGLDHARCGSRHPGLCLRPGRARLE